jgi:hypothetical protein
MGEEIGDGRCGNESGLSGGYIAKRTAGLNFKYKEAEGKNGDIASLQTVVIRLAGDSGYVALEPVSCGSLIAILHFKEENTLCPRHPTHLFLCIKLR